MHINMPHAVAKALNGEPVSLDDILAEAANATKLAIASIGEIDICGIVKHKEDTRWMMVLEDVSGGGRWRTQDFDLNGFVGHITFATKEQAIEHAASMCFTIRDDEALDRIQDTPAFQAGIYACEQLRLLNGRDITLTEYGVRMHAYHRAASASQH